MKIQLGNWHIGRINLVLALAQAYVWFQTASRGMDYVQTRPATATPSILLRIESVMPLTWWGVLFLLGSGTLFMGVNGRWWTVIVAGHILSFFVYAAFTVGSWMEVPIVSVIAAVGGAALLGVGLWVTAHEWHHDWTRFWLATILVGVGGWVCAAGMGYNWRTTTGFLVASLFHATYAVGIGWMATRDQQAADA